MTWIPFFSARKRQDPLALACEEAMRSQSARDRLSAEALRAVQERSTQIIGVVQAMTQARRDNA